MHAMLGRFKWPSAPFRNVVTLDSAAQVSAMPRQQAERQVDQPIPSQTTGHRETAERKFDWEIDSLSRIPRRSRHILVAGGTRVNDNAAHVLSECLDGIWLVKRVSPMFRTFIGTDLR